MVLDDDKVRGKTCHEQPLGVDKAYQRPFHWEHAFVDLKSTCTQGYLIVEM